MPQTRGLWAVLVWCSFHANGFDTAISSFLGRQPRIVGGKPVARGQYNYLALTAGPKLCGATLIHDDILLTSGHCKVDFDDGIYIGGVALSGSDGDFYDVEYVYVHEGYPGSGAAPHDIALVKLVTLVDGIQPVELATDIGLPSEGSTVTVAGWGQIEEEGPLSHPLLETDLDVPDFTSCNNIWGFLLEDVMFCTLAPSGEVADSCGGDSGGPLIDGDGVQVGIVSFGSGCARQNLPSVNTRVGGYRRWIREGVCANSDVPPDYCDEIFFTESPTPDPTPSPTLLPTLEPTKAPTGSPTLLQTLDPTLGTTQSPTRTPTLFPTTKPTHRPTQSPTKLTGNPTLSPTTKPTRIPTTPSPTKAPTTTPTHNPTEGPTIAPTLATPNPTQNPTRIPTKTPTGIPTKTPTRAISSAPITTAPTGSPITRFPSKVPTQPPSTSSPTRNPVEGPTQDPPPQPTRSPATLQPVEVKPSLPPALAPSKISSILTNPVTIAPTPLPTTAAAPNTALAAQETSKATTDNRTSLSTTSCTLSPGGASLSSFIVKWLQYVICVILSLFSWLWRR